MPSEASRDIVQVVLRDRTSISPDWSAVKRCCAVSGTHFTLVGSPSRAAAIARHSSTSRPVQLPWASACANPARPVFTPHTICPRALIASRVLPACAGTVARAPAPPRRDRESFAAGTLMGRAPFLPWRGEGTLAMPARAGRSGKCPGAVVTAHGEPFGIHLPAARIVSRPADTVKGRTTAGPDLRRAGGARRSR